MLTGLGIVVTGASRGLGFEIARACIDAGADVLIAARDPDRLAAAVDELRRVAPADRYVAGQPTDVADSQQVRRLVQRGRDELPRPWGLVNNAGIYGPKGRLDDSSPEDWWSAVTVNLGGTAATMREMLPILRERGGGRIVNLSGGGATAPMPRFSAYAASKAGVVRLTETVAVEEADQGITVNAVAPGALDTAMLDELLDAGPDRVGAELHERALALRASGGTPLHVPAGLVTFLLSHRSDGITGRLISAPWDPWEDLPRHLDELASGDVYTLRRVLPADRGRTW